MSRKYRWGRAARDRQRGNSAGLRLERLEGRHLLTAQLPGTVLDLNALEFDVDSFDEGNILVRFSPEYRVATAAREHGLGASILQGTEVGAQLARVPGLHRISLSDEVDVTAALAAYRKSPLVLYAEPDFRVRIADDFPDDGQFPDMWALNNTGQTGGRVDADIDAPGAWDVTHGSGSTVVAVIDTGVDYTHPDLVANMWVNSNEVAGDGIDNDGNGYVDDVHGYDFINQDGDPMDDQGHGTHVAGTIGAVGNNGEGVTGIHWNVQIMALKFLGADGAGNGSDAIEALRYAIDNGAVISNNSWGGDPFSQAMFDAINEARSRQHIFVAAAGNGNMLGIGQDNDANPFYPAGYDLDNIISVAAVDHNDDLGSFSNFGATTVDLAAPGVNILSTTRGGGYGLSTGTSMAAPHATGVTSLVWDVHPEWTYLDVVDQILGTVDPIPELYGVTVTGGRLNAAAAMDNPEPLPPALPPGTLPILDDFTDAVADYFRPRTGNWSAQGGRYHAHPVAENHDLMAITTLDVADPLPANLEFQATINADEGRLELFGLVLSDHLTNGFVVFDYHSPDEFRFAGPDMREDRWIIGHRDAGEWYDDAVFHEILNASTDYNLQVRIESHTNVTLLADGVQKLAFSSNSPVTGGGLGLGMRDSTTHFDDVAVRALKHQAIGPRVLASGPPVLSIANAVSVLRVEFDEPVDAGTFTEEDVIGLAGPGFPIGITDVTEVAGSNGLEFNVSLITPTEPGDYSLTIGPEILDLTGNPMDQDGDTLNGEPNEDGYVVQFRLVPFAAQYDFGMTDSPVAKGYTGVDPTDAYDPSTGYGWHSAPVGSRDRAAGTDLTRDLVYAGTLTFAVDVPGATYDVTLTLGDMGQWGHEQMAVYLEGTQVDAVDTAAGETKTITYTDIDVQDGQLTIRVEDHGGSDSNVMVNGLEVVWVSDTSGPRVLASDPSGTMVAESVDRITLTFSEAVLDGSFTLADVTGLTGPSGPITATAVNPLGPTEYEVVLPLQNEVGDYSLTIGPEVLDLFGNPMDQDGDGLNGELADDRYVGGFQLTPFAARYDFGTTSSPVAEGYAGVDPTDVYDPSTGYGWQAAPVGSRDRVAGTDLTRDLVYAAGLTFAVDVPLATYDVTLTLGDMGSWGHDQMVVILEGTQVDAVDTAAGETKTITYSGIDVQDGQLTVRVEDHGGSDGNVMVNGLEVLWVPDTLGPRVVAADPIDTVVAESLDRLTLTFSEAVLDGSFTVDDVTDLTGPSGPITATAVNPLGPTEYEIVFPVQHEAGNYNLAIGPEILDLSGNPMDQDGDGLNGELDDDRYASGFYLTPFAARYDFGTTSSPVAEGYTGVDPADLYDPSTGYGWQAAPVGSRDRAAGTDVTRDLVYAAALTFAVDVPGGSYDVTLTLGDMGPWGHDQMVVILEGTQVDAVDTAAGETKTITYSGIDVQDGQLTVRVEDHGGSDGNVMVNGLEVHWVPDTLGPRVVTSDPLGTVVAESLDRLALTFSEAVLDGSFTLDDVTGLTGPSGPITATAVNPLGPTEYEIVFPVQHEAGNYNLAIGPEILDLSGNPMDQDGDGLNGELDDDRYASGFYLTPFAARYDFGTTSSPVAEGYTGVDPADLYDPSTGYGWQAAPVGSRDRAAGTDVTRDLVYAGALTFAVDVPGGSYDVTLTLGDMGPWGHDQMVVILEGTQVDAVDTAAGETKTITYSGIDVQDGQLTVRVEDHGGSDGNVMVNGLEVHWVPDTLGPRVVTSDPLGTVVAESVDRLALTFSEAVLDGSFTLDDVTGLTGPSGPITATAVNPLGPTEYEIVFPVQHEAGNYNLAIGPEILDLSGNPMDQDGDGLNGELDDDRYASGFYLTPFAARYDFGTTSSPVAEGYTGVDPADLYDPSTGYGWQAVPVGSRDRAAGTDVTRDLVYAGALTFAVDVPGGSYDVTLTLGDMGRWGHDQMAVFLEGTQVDSVDTAARETKTITYSAIDVQDGQLTVRVEDHGGSDGNVMVNGLEVTAVAGSVVSLAAFGEAPSFTSAQETEVQDPFAAEVHDSVFWSGDHGRQRDVSKAPRTGGFGTSDVVTHRRDSMPLRRLDGLSMSDFFESDSEDSRDDLHISLDDRLVEQLALGQLLRGGTTNTEHLA